MQRTTIEQQLRRVRNRLLAPNSEREELLATRELLHDHPCGRDHRQAPVVQLLRLHLLELRRIRRLQPKRVEAEVAGLMVSANGPRLPLRRRLASRVRRTDRLESEDRVDLGD